VPYLRDHIRQGDVFFVLGGGGGLDAGLWGVGEAAVAEGRDGGGAVGVVAAAAEGGQAGGGCVRGGASTVVGGVAGGGRRRFGRGWGRGAEVRLWSLRLWLPVLLAPLIAALQRRG